MLVTVANVRVLVAALALAPVTTSVCVPPPGLVPVIVNVSPVSSPVLVMVTKRGGVNVTVLLTRVKLPAPDGDCEAATPSVSAAVKLVVVN
jgi:hypothetical protein